MVQAREDASRFLSSAVGCPMVRKQTRVVNGLPCRGRAGCHLYATKDRFVNALCKDLTEISMC